MVRTLGPCVYARRSPEGPDAGHVYQGWDGAREREALVPESVADLVLEPLEFVDAGKAFVWPWSPFGVAARPAASQLKVNLPLPTSSVMARGRSRSASAVRCQGGSVLTADAAHTAAVLQVKATLRARRLRHPAAQRSAEQRQGFVHLDEAVLVDLVGL